GCGGCRRGNRRRRSPAAGPRPPGRRWPSAARAGVGQPEFELFLLFLQPVELLQPGLLADGGRGRVGELGQAGAGGAELLQGGAEVGAVAGEAVLGLAGGDTALPGQDLLVAAGGGHLGRRRHAEITVEGSPELAAELAALAVTEGGKGAVQVSLL